MADNEDARTLHNGSFASKAFGAWSGGFLLVRKTASTLTPMMPHGHTLQFLISIIKNSQQRGPGAADSIKEGES